MSKWRITKKGSGDYVATEETEADILDPHFWLSLLGGLGIFIVLGIVIGAIILLSKAFGNLEDHLEQKKVEAQMAVSASIWDLDIEDSNSTFSINKKGIEVDSYGNEYETPSVDFCSWTQYEDLYEAFAIIDVSSKYEYKRLTGTIFTRPEQDEELDITFKIYADNRCIFDSGEMHRSTKAIDFDLDISGADRIKFSATSDDYDGWCNPGVILVNAQVHAE